VSLPRLVALSPGTLTGAALPGFLRAARAALGAGLPGLLLREPGLGDRECLELMSELRALCGPEAWLACHDRAHLARLARADAVHLGFRSLPPAEVRAALPGLAIGLSTHAGDDGAEWGQADYLFHGPVRETPGKAAWQQPIGMAGLARGVLRAPRPVLAIGGLEPQDVAAVLGAGAHGLAVRRGVLAARDPARAVRAYRSALDRVLGAEAR
jgi:thiamine-phosphate diphosphorylase